MLYFVYLVSFTLSPSPAGHGGSKLREVLRGKGVFGGNPTGGRVSPEQIQAQVERAGAWLKVRGYGLW